MEKILLWRGALPRAAARELPGRITHSKRTQRSKRFELAPLRVLQSGYAVENRKALCAGEKERGKNFCFTLTTNGRGFQYTGRVFRQKLVQAGMTQSMSRVLRVALTMIPWKASGIS